MNAIVDMVQQRLFLMLLNLKVGGVRLGGCSHIFISFLTNLAKSSHTQTLMLE